MTLPLPGDEESVRDAEIRRVIRRDGRLTPLERKAGIIAELCVQCARGYGFWHCSYREPCCYCEELK